MCIYELENSVRKYEWGSTHIIQDLLGVSQDEPEHWAELWIGAHPRSPSIVSYQNQRLPLDHWIAESPNKVLGNELSERFNGTLPYLFKVLAIGSPLSLQVHPDRVQAQKGFRREEREGIPLMGPNRSFPDPNSKSEMLCALTPFNALCGFRLPPDRERLIAPLECGDLMNSCWQNHDPLVFLSNLWEMPAAERAELVQRTIDAVILNERIDKSYHWVSMLNHLYPGDVGCLAPLFMQLLELDPGDAFFLPPGTLHAYLSGAGIELTSNSDNVVRGALTAKHVSPDSLLQTINEATANIHPVPSVKCAPGCWRYTPPDADFELLKIEVAEAMKVNVPASEGIEFALCWDGTGTITVGSETKRWSAGKSFLVTGTHPELQVGGSGTLYLARTNRAAADN